MRKLDDVRSSTAHSLIELSDKQWSRLETRSIVLSNMKTIPVSPWSSTKYRVQIYYIGERYKIEAQQKCLEW